MKPPSLKELQAQQRAAGITAPRDDDESMLVTGVPIRHEIPAAPPAPPTPGRVLIGSSQVEISPKLRGFIAMLPPQYTSVAALPAGWVEENWAGPSPWCHIEGQPDHPEFEANLRAWEESQR